MKHVSDIPEDELGVELDVAIDTAVDAGHVKQSLDDMEVQLDSFADNGDFAPGHVKNLRQLQSEVADVAELFETIESSQRDRAERIRERIQDVQENE